MSPPAADLPRRLASATAPLVGLAAFFGLWELAVRAFGVEVFVMPPPSSIVRTVLDTPGKFAREGLVTAREAACGLLLAFGVALALAVPMARRRAIERGMQPILTFLQLVPLVVYAPAFVIWMGTGFRPIVAVSALFAVLPLTYNLTSGLKAADGDAIDVLRSVGASPSEILRHVEVPSALPFVFAGLRTAVGLALIGAVLCEWFAVRSHGLGVVIQRGIAKADATLVWGSAVSLAVIGMIALAVVTVAERATRHGAPRA